jgi:Holliday junction DNA helicase RuvA
MMSFLRGEVLHRGVGYVIVEQAGIGHKITVPEAFALDTDRVAIFLHEVVRDNERELFGFRDVDQLELFWKLVAVSGVGPKIAQKIVFTDTVDGMKAKIMSGDLAAMTSVPGIGKKTAQKIFLELKGALAQEPEVAVFDQDAVEALIGLGYARRDAEAALSGLDAQTTDDRLRAALKRLAK